MSSNQNPVTARDTPIHYTEGLDAAQLQVLAHDDHTLAIAGPGSGKTRVLIAKARKYIETLGPQSVALVTFSKASATEMHERLAAQVGKAVAKKVAVDTFHAHCSSMLKTYWRLQRKNEPRLLNDAQAQELVRLAAQQLLLPDDFIAVGEYAAAIGRCKARCEPAQTAEANISPEKINRLVEIYEELKTARHAIDFADLILLATKAIQEGKLQPLSVKHLLVDEYQDVDLSQLQWLKEHHKRGVILHVVGDDDQAIYGFRESLGYAAMKAAQDWGAKPIFMSKNYRCDHFIISLAAVPLAGIKDRFEKSIRAHSDNDGEILVVAADSIGREVGAALQHYHELAAKNPNAVMALLGRTNEQLQTFEKEATDLMASGEVPYLPIRRYGGKAIAENQVIQRRFALLMSAIYPYDPHHFLNAFAAIPLSEAGYRKVYDCIAGMKNTHVLDPLFQTVFLDSLEKNDKKILRDARDIYSVAFEEYEKLKEASDDSGQIPNRLLNEWVTNTFASADKMEKKVLSLHKIATQMVLSLGGPIHARIMTLSIRTSEVDTTSPGLVLLTLHKSKGLEFESVWIFGCSDGKLPLENKDQNVQTNKPLTEAQQKLATKLMDEERRLFYVGCTRAKNLLVISHTGKASVFLKEIKNAEQ